MNIIPSEQQAERLGQQRTGGKREQAFKVFRYQHKGTGLTLFAIKIIATNEIIALA